MNAPWKSLWVCAPALLLLTCVAFAGPEKKPEGQVADAGGLLKVHTFCLDITTLAPAQEASLRKVLSQAVKPKGALTRLHWQVLDSCGSADATVTLKIEQHEESVPTGDYGAMVSPMPERERTPRLKSKTISQVKMTIADRASGTALYQVNGAPRDSEQSAFESPFTKLSKDVAALGH